MADEYGGVIPELKMKDIKNVNGKFQIIHPKMKGKRAGLVVFYHYWCGYCMQLAPEFKKFGAKVHKNIMVGAVHGSDVKNSNHLLFEAMGMQGVPDIRFVDANGIVSQESYQGERTVEAFNRYINEKAPKKGGAKKKVVKKVKKKTIKKKAVKKVKKKTIKKKVVKKVKKKTIKKKAVKKVKKKVVKKKKPVKRVKKRVVRKNKK